MSAGSNPVRSTNGSRRHKGSVKPFSVIKIVTGLEFRGSIPSAPTKKNLTNVWIVKKYPYICKTNGPLVKRLTRYPFTVEARVRIPYGVQS